MPNIIRITCLFALFLLIVSCSKKREGSPKILVLTKTQGFKHASIPYGVAAIQQMGLENDFEVDTSSVASVINEDNLGKYAAVVFLNTTGNIFNNKQEAAFERYIQAGGGYVGIHSAADTEYDWGWYTKLVGAQFLSHPPGVHEADFKVKRMGFMATQFFQDSIWKHTDELYNFRKINPNIEVLITVDETTYEGGENGDFHPISWYHEYDGGRAFYTAAGHTNESFSEPMFIKHILGGIQYAIGDNLKLNYKKAITQIPPDADRFSKVTLSQGEFFEPMEMTILPNNDILIAQRRGEIMRFEASTNKLTEVARLNVYHTALNTPNVNEENGLLALQKDPNYSVNNWVYLYYAPSGEDWVNRLSRFKYKEGNFDLDSEEIILTIPTDREICCHVGSSIAFDSNGLLYLSTGDNSTPFNEPDVKYANQGYAPLNDLPGKKQYDARRTSGNTNDLRGKIIRIKVNDDGTYDIPEGNLFPLGTEKTRPEIYTMGHRNPFRISVDPKNGYVYWGDIGPDAGNDSLQVRGPKGYDEIGQAKQAGNFGWPLFIADNKPYVDYDYKTGQSGSIFDPNAPINDSKNNTGLQQLPPAQPALVYYPYGASLEFPQTTTGGRNAMAGPVYYLDQYKGNNKLPMYYDGKFLMYDWMRNWIMAVSFFEDGTIRKMEPFADEITLNSLIDMEVGEDGRIYLLEYGNGWFSKNSDSGLSYIDFNAGNRPPVVNGLFTEKTSGKLPFKVKATVEAMDREGDAITYTWNLGDGTTKETKENSLTHTYTKEGDYELSVEVKDEQGEVAKSDLLQISAGLERPEVKIKITEGNSSFYIPNVPFSYEVAVTYPNQTQEINYDEVFVTMDNLQGMDQVGTSKGHQRVSEISIGEALTKTLDCKACHKLNEKSIGPNYMEVSEKYKEDNNAIAYLQQKIIEGGGGVWGEVMMPAHPNITAAQANQIAMYIQSLTGAIKIEESLPLKGTIKPKGGLLSDNSTVLLTASYTDAGTDKIKPFTSVGSLSLPKGRFMIFEDIERKEGFDYFNYEGIDLLLIPNEDTWFALDDIDLTNVSNILIAVGWIGKDPKMVNYTVRKNTVNGEIIAENGVLEAIEGQRGGMLTIPLKKAINEKIDKLYFTYKPYEGQGLRITPLATVFVEFQ